MKKEAATQEVVNSVSTDKATIKIYASGILHIHFHENADFDVEDKKLMFKETYELTLGKKYPTLFTADDGVSFTREAQAYGREQEPNLSYSCVALIVSNMAYRLLINFYINYYKPEITYKTFSNIDESYIWLLEQVEKNKKKKDI